MITLTEAEWEVMKILWSKENNTLSEIVKCANDKGIPWAMNTIHTLLSRLAKKNAVAVDKSVSPHIYYPTVDEHECAITETTKLIQRIYNGSISKMFSSLLSSEKISENELNELKNIINNFSKNKEGK